MRSRLMLVILFVALSSSFALAQLSPENYFPFKDMIFAQVAAGGGLESLITLNNRGTDTYAGTAYFYKGQGEDPVVGIPWNPLVGGTAITGGQYALTIAPGKTVSLRITGAGGTETGYIVIKRADFGITNFLEGNLTYFIKSGGQIVDSIGVLPSTPFVYASLPFDDFSTVALAYANTDYYGRVANVTLRLYDADNILRDTFGPVVIGARGHGAEYLPEIFEGTSIQRGRVEMQSDVYICGIAMTQAAGGQFSSLPLGSTVRSYNVNTGGVGVSLARISLWTEGVFVCGYVTAERLGQTEVFLVYGQLSGLGGDKKLQLHFDGNSAMTGNYSMFGLISINPPFKWGDTAFSGSFHVAGSLPTDHWEEHGTFGATLIQ
jgi:hypothetical protein